MQIGVSKKVIPLRGPPALVAVTVLFLTGIGVGYQFPAVTFQVCAVAFALCLAWLAVRRRMGAVDVAVAAVCVLLVGAGRVAWNAGTLAREIESVNALVKPQAFECRVTSDAVVTPLTGQGARYTFDVGAVTWRDGGRVFRLRCLPVTVTWYGSIGDRLSAPQPGEAWRLSGRIQVKEKRNGLSHGFLSTGKGEARSARLVALGDTLLGRLSLVRRDAVRRVALGVEDWGVVPALNQAMLLGCRNEMPEEMQRVFAASGTIHVFAISGLHIALVAGVLIFFVKLTGLNRLHWAFVVVPLLIVYTVITGARPSAVRACCTAACMLLAPLLERKPNGLAALLGTALVLHFWQPSLVFNIGSVLSFSVMAGLIVLVPRFSGLLRRGLGYAALQDKITLLDAAGNRAQAKRVRWAAAAVRYVADVFAVSVAAWLVSVPLTGYYFGRVPMGGLLANPVVTSCAFMVVTAGCLGLLAGLVSAWVAMAFNNAAGFFTMVMVRTAEATAAVRVLSPETGTWPGWAVAAWFAALAALAVWMRRGPQKADGLEWLTEGHT